jgi:hypothetical protein
MRGRDFVHNNGWYNKVGEKLGWGDLSPEDFRKISLELEKGELFIILSESDSFWNFVTQPGIIGSMAAVKPTEDAPGVDYVAEKARYIIQNGQLYSVDRYGDSDKETLVTRDGLTFKVLSREAVKALIASTATQTV